MERSSSLRAEIEATDNDMVVALLAASQSATIISELEECLVRARRALTAEESTLESEYRDRSSPHIIQVLENDVSWKSELLDTIPLGATADQLRAVAVLVKSRPFLQDL